MTHAGLLLTKSPGNYIGKFPKPDEQTDPLRKHLDEIQSVCIPAGYAKFFETWQNSIKQIPDVRVAKLTSTSRTLIGHGLASTHQVGLSLHHTYGIPFIPGSALKGVTAHYVHEVLGSADERFRGPTLDDTGRVVKDPGEYFRGLFGAAPSETDPRGFEGYVEFHETLVDPTSQSLFVADVLTPHQVSYYRDATRDPNEYTSPVPVGFVTARPGLCYHLALSGFQDWTRLALACLGRALSERGIGGKTASGYGRFNLEGGVTEQEETEAALRSAREAELAHQAELQRQQRAQRRERIIPDLATLAARVPTDLDAWQSLLTEARSFVEAADVTFEAVVNTCAAMANANRAGWQGACGDGWPALTDELKKRWAGAPTTEVPARMWRARKLGDVTIQRADAARADDVKAHVIAFANVKLYQDKQYQLDLPDKVPAEPNVIVVLENGRKVIGVKKP